MEKIVIAAVLLSLCIGCKSTKKESGPEPVSNRRATATTKPGPGERSTVRPIVAVSGRIIAVREALRFVVIDFGSTKMPKLDQRLFAYRLDQKVAELKVSGPYLGTTVAADIMAGEVKEGDLAIFLLSGSTEVVYDAETYYIVPQAAILMLEREEDL